MSQSKSIYYFFYFLIIIILITVSVYYFRQDRDGKNPAYVEKKLNQLKSSDINLKEYKNETYKISLQYPANWYPYDLGGQKNLAQENIVLFFDPKEGEDSATNPLASASLKLNRYQLEEGKKISSAEDWFNYIKEKVENAKNSHLAKANQYQFISLEKRNDINSQWAVEENYQELVTMRGKDIYIYHNGEFYYQLVSRAKKIAFETYQPYFEAMINSFKIEK